MEANGRIGQIEAVEAKLSRLKNYHKVLNFYQIISLGNYFLQVGVVDPFVKPKRPKTAFQLFLCDQKLHRSSSVSNDTVSLRQHSATWQEMSSNEVRKYSVDAVPPGLILVVIESFAAAAIRGPKCKIEGRLRKGPDQVTAGYHLLLCSDNLDNYVERILAIYHLDLVSRWRAKMERLELLGLEAARARRDWKRS